LLTTAELREEVFSTPPHERLEKLSELGARKREIELSQPVRLAPPPEWSMPPEWDEPPLVFSQPPAEESLHQSKDASPQVSEYTQQDQNSEPHAFEPFKTSMLGIESSSDHQPTDLSDEEEPQAFEPFKTSMLSIESSSDDLPTDPSDEEESQAYKPFRTDSFDQVNLPEVVDAIESLPIEDISEELPADMDHLDHEVSPAADILDLNLEESAHLEEPAGNYDPPSMVFFPAETPHAGPPIFSAPPLPESIGPPPPVVPPSLIEEAADGALPMDMEDGDHQQWSDDDLLSQLSNQLDALAPQSVIDEPGQDKPVDSVVQEHNLTSRDKSSKPGLESESGGASND